MKKGDRVKVVQHEGGKALVEHKKISTSNCEQDTKAIRDRWPFPDKPLNNLESKKKNGRKNKIRNKCA